MHGVNNSVMVQGMGLDPRSQWGIPCNNPFFFVICGALRKK
jgi:hypothetical protein